MQLNIIHNTDALSGLKSLPDESVDCIVTSPPYWQMRDYGIGGIEWPDGWFGQLGASVPYLRRVPSSIEILRFVVGKFGRHIQQSAQIQPTAKDRMVRTFKKQFMPDESTGRYSTPSYPP